MNALVEVFESRLYAGSVADEIVASISDDLADKGSCTVGLAGGGTPGNIYRAMAAPPRVTEVEWDKVKFLLGDERWVPHEDILSNYRMVQETLVGPLSRYQRPKTFPVDTSLGSPSEAAARYETVLRNELEMGDQGVPQFDILLLGIGEDGHTASLFPNSPLLSEARKLCDTCPHPTDGTQRVSITPPLLLNARRIFVLITGEGKSEMVRRILEGEDPIERIPARLVMQSKSRVSFFLDSAAASKLKASYRG